ncbi:hypothetical protein CSA80_02330 [Candidatus Saccharibacteria bacterium]|nr:MAG: hypothetical protein CR973_00420 [Candidatus Saccharibacteria bacterium]PID99575.1 MAG: hypothetical protein CSA80_02330 [Candidatus Saccharibacteria bacterium]
MQGKSRQSKAFNEQEKLFVSLAEGVNHAMLQLALLSEQAGGMPTDSQSERWQAVQDISRASLQLLESYTLMMRLHGGTAEPELEPVALTSVLPETLQLLQPYAKQLHVSLEVDVPARLEPVITDRAIMQSALLSLGQVFIAAQSESGEENQVVRLGAHRSRYGVVTGWYSQRMQLTTQALRRARQLGGWTQQPYGELVSGPATGVFIADGLLSAVASTLHVARYHNASGLAATLPRCRQLQLV